MTLISPQPPLLTREKGAAWPVHGSKAVFPLGLSHGLGGIERPGR